MNVMTRKMILVVDDNKAIRQILYEYLVIHDFDVITAEDGSHAQFETDRHPEIDLIVSDIEMPNMSGLQLLDKLRRQGNQIPLILMSGNFESHQIPPGIVTFKKPIDLKGLLEQIEKLLGEY